MVSLLSETISDRYHYSRSVLNRLCHLHKHFALSIKISVDRRRSGAYNTNNYKPMTRRSSFAGFRTESRGRCERGRMKHLEWIAEGGLNGVSPQVGETGFVPP